MCECRLVKFPPHQGIFLTVYERGQQVVWGMWNRGGRGWGCLEKTARWHCCLPRGSTGCYGNHLSQFMPSFGTRVSHWLVSQRQYIFDLLWIPNCKTDGGFYKIQFGPTSRLDNENKDLRSASSPSHPSLLWIHQINNEMGAFLIKGSFVASVTEAWVTLWLGGALRSTCTLSSLGGFTHWQKWCQCFILMRLDIGPSRSLGLKSINESKIHLSLYFCLL